MSEAYKIKDQNGLYYLTLQVVYWVHLLEKSNNGKLSDIVRDFKSYTSKQIFSAIDEGTESRKSWLLFMFKRAAMRHKRNSEYQFWTHENHAEHIYSNNFMMQKLTYNIYTYS